MAKEFLHGPDVGLVPEHLRGAGVAEGVRVDVFFDLRFSGVALGQLPDYVLRERPVPQGEKQGLVKWIADQLRPHGFDVVFQIPAGDPA